MATHFTLPANDAAVLRGPRLRSVGPLSSSSAVTANPRRNHRYAKGFPAPPEQPYQGLWGGGDFNNGRVDILTLTAPIQKGPTSLVLAGTRGKSGTTFAFDAGRGRSERRPAVDALTVAPGGELILTIGGEPVRAAPRTLVHQPANAPRRPWRRTDRR